LDVVGGSKGFWFTHVQGFLGPRAYHALSMAASSYGSARRAPYLARECLRRPSLFAEHILAAVVRNNVDEVWIRLTEAGRAPDQASKDQALLWTSLHGEAAMHQLLLQHGALEMSKMHGWLDEQQFEAEAFLRQCQASERHRPDPSRVLQFWSLEERSRDIMGMARLDIVPRGTVFKAVWLADRFFAAAEGLSEGEDPRRIMLVCLGLAAKVDGHGVGIGRRIQAAMPAREIAGLERRILRATGYELDVPTQEALLESVCPRIFDAAESLIRLDRKLCMNVACVILCSATMDPRVLYMWPPVVLATVALGCAILSGSNLAFEPSACELEKVALLHGILEANLAAAGIALAPAEKMQLWLDGERLMRHCLRLHGAPASPGPLGGKLLDGWHVLERFFQHRAHGPPGR